MGKYDMSLMAVFAHPDDESFGPSAALAMYAARGIKTYLVCATRGEAGKVHGEEASLSSGELGRLREEELKCAAEAMNLTGFRILGYPDGGLQSSDFDELTSGIVAAIREFRPQVMITFGPEGITGHKDHITVGRAAEEAFNAAGDPARFGEGIAAGLEPYSPAKLYYYVLPQRMVEALGLHLTGTEDSRITTEIDVSGFEEFRVMAIRCHQSQLELATEKQDSGSEALRKKYRRVNYFQLVASRVSSPAGLERDLFVGLQSE